MAPSSSRPGERANVELSRLEKASLEEACAAEIADADQAARASAADMLRLRSRKGEGRRLAHLRRTARRSSIRPCSRRAGPRIGIWRRRTAWSRLNFSGRRSIAPPAMPAIATATERQLRQDAAAAGPDVGADRGPATPGRALHHHRLAHRPRRPQTPAEAAVHDEGSCWRWRERHGSQSSARCSSAAPEALFRPSAHCGEKPRHPETGRARSRPAGCACPCPRSRPRHRRGRPDCRSATGRRRRRARRRGCRRNCRGCRRARTDARPAPSLRACCRAGRCRGS